MKKIKLFVILIGFILVSFSITGCTGTTTAENYTKLGEQYFDAHQNDTAIEYYEKAIQLNPNYPDAYKHIMLAYQELARSTADAQQSNIFYDKALDYGNKLINLNPNDYKSYNAVGFVYYSRGMIDKANEYQAKAKELRSPH